MMKGEEAMEIFKLVKAKGMLPQKMDDLVPLSFIGQAAVSFYRSKIKLMDQLKMTEEQRNLTLRDGQDAGEMLLDIEARIGELLPSPEEAIKTPVTRPTGITHHRAIQARAISKHPEIVEKVKAQAKENEDIPTKTAVLNAINYEKEKKRRIEAESKKEDSKGIILIEQAEYINALDRCISILPTKPPAKWGEATLKEAKAKAQIIIKRLEVFTK